MVLKNRQEPLNIDARLTRQTDRELFDLRFNAMGTQCRIQYLASGADAAERFARAAVAWVVAFEQKYSRFRDDSLISEINRQAGRAWVAIDTETESLLALCDQFHFLTEGILDPTLLPAIKLWYGRPAGLPLPSESEIAQAMRTVGWSKVQRRPGAVLLPEVGMCLDFGGFGKEYAVDAVAALAKRHGIVSCLVDFGRDIFALGAPPDGPTWRIGLEDPRAPGTTWGSVAVCDQAVASSGSYRRFFERAGRRYGHIVDPRTGQPSIRATLAVNVVASSCLEAGALATAGCVLGEVEGLRLVESVFGAEACFVGDRRILQTTNFYENWVEC